MGQLRNLVPARTVASARTERRGHSDPHRGAPVSRVVAALLLIATMGLLALLQPVGVAGGLSEEGQPQWTYVYGPSQQTEIAGITCLTATRCLAYGIRFTTNFAGRALVTSTGGKIWQSTTIAGIDELETATCSTVTNCVGVGVKLPENTGPPLAVLMHSSDGGMDWTETTVTTRGTLSAIAFIKILCPAAETCYTVGIHSTSRETHFEWLFATTTNGGVSWTRHTLPLTTNTARDVSFACPSTQECLVAGATSPKMLRTVNAGTTWTPVTLHMFVTTMVCTSTANCIAAGETTAGAAAGVVDVTSDGGTTWSAHLDPTALTFTHVACGSATACIATGSTANFARLYDARTEDAGTTWVDGQLYAAPSKVIDGKTYLGEVRAGSLACPSAAVCFLGAYQHTTATERTGVRRNRRSTLDAPLRSRPSVHAHPETSRSTGPLVLATSDGGSSWSTQAVNDHAFPETLDCPSIARCYMVGTNGILVGPPVQPVQGYWLADSAGDVYSFGTAAFHGSMGGKTLNAPVVAMAPTPDGDGYWLVAADGGIFAFGDAAFYGSMGGRPLNKPIVGVASTPDGKGYWEVASDGGIFAFGDAAFHGSMGGMPLNEPVVGMAVDPATGGYWEVAADGGIFSFGAPFFGSTGNLRLNKPIVGMTALLAGDGYWFVASDGGVFSFGAAGFHGSMVGLFINATITSMAATADGQGYRLVGTDGGVYCFGDAAFYGSMAGVTLTGPYYTPTTPTSSPPPPTPTIVSVVTSTAST